MSLSIFDLCVTFDPAILGFRSVSYGNPTLVDQSDLFGLGSLTQTTPKNGGDNLFKLSLKLPNDLNNLQAWECVLATLTSDTLTLGTIPLGHTINALSDAGRNPLIPDVQSGRINLVYEPFTLLLLAGDPAGS